MAFGDIVLLKDRTPRGPFTRKQIQEGLSCGDFSARDLAHTPGLRDWLPLLEVLHHLDREVVHWPRTREGRELPPLPNAPAPVPAAPSSLPPVPLLARSGPPGLPLPVTEDFAAAAWPSIEPVTPPLEKAAILPPSLVQPPKLTGPGFPKREPALFGRRLMAFLIDLGILFLPVLAVFGFAYAVGAIRGSLEHRDPETERQEQALLWRNLRDLMLLVANGLAWIYAAGLESSRWQGTIGKQAMGLVVTDEAGGRIHFLQATARHAAKYLSALPLFLGFMAALAGPQRLAWHDRLARTRVAKRINSL